MIIVRHGHAGDKARWHGDDEARPLSELGLRQAQGAVSVLAGDPLEQIWTSPSTRCRQSVEPLAATRGLVARTTPLLAKDADSEPLLAWLREAGAAAPWLVCTHGEVLRRLHGLAAATGLLVPPGLARTPKGGGWRLHEDAAGSPHRPVRLEPIAPDPAR